MEKTSRILHHNFIIQQQDSTCFPVSLINCGIYLKKQLSLNKYINFCCCNNGNALNTLDAIKMSKLPLHKTMNISEVFKFGGIIVIMHPIFNLHSIFVYPEKNDICLINSWLGPNVMTLDKKTINKFLAKSPNNIFWKIRNI